MKWEMVFLIWMSWALGMDPRGIHFNDDDRNDDSNDGGAGDQDEHGSQKVSASNYVDVLEFMAGISRDICYT